MATTNAWANYPEGEKRDTVMAFAEDYRGFISKCKTERECTDFLYKKAIQEGFVPPTVNLDEPDLEHGCDLDYTPNVGVKCDIQVAASCSLGFGGHNGCLIIKKFIP